MWFWFNGFLVVFVMVWCVSLLRVSGVCGGVVVVFSCVSISN